MEHLFYLIGGTIGTAALFILLLPAIALYVLGALGLYRLAKNRGIPYAWIAWIPWIQNWLLGDLTGGEMWGFGGSSLVLVLTPPVLALLSMTGVGALLAAPLSIAFVVYTYMVLYKLFKMYAPDTAVLFLVLGILFSFLIPIWYFIIRNNKPDTSQLYQDTNSGEPVYTDADHEAAGKTVVTRPQDFKTTATPQPTAPAAHKESETTSSELNTDALLKETSRLTNEVKNYAGPTVATDEPETHPATAMTMESLKQETDSVKHEFDAAGKAAFAAPEKPVQPEAPKNTGTGRTLKELKAETAQVRKEFDAAKTDASKEPSTEPKLTLTPFTDEPDKH